MFKRIRRFIVWRWLLPLAKKIDEDWEPGDEKYMERVKKSLHDVDNDKGKE